MIGICRAERRARDCQRFGSLGARVRLIVDAETHNVGVANYGTVAQNTSNGIGDSRPVGHEDGTVFVDGDTVKLGFIQ